MNKMRVILSKIGEGKTIDTLSRELGMRESTLRAMVDSMVHTGYLEEIQCMAGCGMCPTKCSLPSSSKIKIYCVTEKGMECINGAKWWCKDVWKKR